MQYVAAFWIHRPILSSSPVKLWWWWLLLLLQNCTEQGGRHCAFVKSLRSVRTRLVVDLVNHTTIWTDNWYQSDRRWAGRCWPLRYWYRQSATGRCRCHVGAAAGSRLRSWSQRNQRRRPQLAYVARQSENDACWWRWVQPTATIIDWTYLFCIWVNYPTSYMSIRHKFARTWLKKGNKLFTAIYFRYLYLKYW